MNRRVSSSVVVLGALALLAMRAAFSAQVHCASPEQVADRFVIAVARTDQDALTALLGDDYRTLLPVDAIDAKTVEQFLDAWSTFHGLVAVNDSERLLAAGDKGWTLPIPIVRDDEGWRFDVQAGSDMLRTRRIGRNELAAMQAALAYHDAQIEYASKDRDGDGVLEYAQRFVSDAGTQDGLYWDTQPGQPESPLGPLFADKVPTDAYHGYHYRILTAQGEHAPGGAADYLSAGKLTGGFALVAWPAAYGDSGVMSFLMGPSGTLYQADLGADGAQVASTLTAFDPDERWSQVPAEFTDAAP